MPRPSKYRKIFSNPAVFNFKPVGRELDENYEVELSLDEFEAIRLADYEGIYQEQAAEQMNISRQTFGNILNSAHKKIADFIINAKSLKIKGGSIEMQTADSSFVCFGCRLFGKTPFSIDKMELCPNCVSPHLHHLQTEKSVKDNIRKEE